MASRTITSPGVQINEVDLSLIARPSGETNIFITGFSSQGPTDEIINVTSVSEFESIFGIPTNAAERYLYHSAKQILTTSPANLLVSRLPYGENLGEGFSNKRSVLVYPIKTQDSVNVAALSSVNGVIALSGGYPVYLGYDKEVVSDYKFTNIQNTANVVYNNTIVSVVTSYASSLSSISYEDARIYNIQEPKSIVINDNEYTKLVTNDVAWLSAYNNGTIDSFEELGYGGIVVINDAKTTINNIYEGYYVGLADNSNVNPSTNFESITGVKSYSGITGNLQTFVSVPNNRFNFQLQGDANSLINNSISEIIESSPIGYDFSSNVFNDYLTTMVLKLRPSIYQQDTVSLDYVVTESNTGSLYSLRQLNNPNGGSPSTSFLDNLVNTSSNNIKIVTNPYISNTGNWISSDGTPSKKVRVSNGAKNLYGVGVYVSDTDKNSKVVDNVPAKLERTLRCIENDDSLSIDVVAECGLGTIWANAKARKLNPNYSNQPIIFDDLYNLDITDGLPRTGLKDSTGADSSCTAKNEYLKVINQFYAFADKTRKDHVFISDPLRNIFVQGSNTKISKDKNFIFSNDIYWPLKNLYSGVESSYVATYANWVRTNDNSSDSLCWIPSSGYVASVYATSAQVSYPWSAPAGFNRGKLVNVIDLAINPTQKQRDLLYKININPIAFFVNDGNVIFGQKTLYRKPSAFDRVNVRRLFLTLEKTTKDILKLFVFEPNSFTTRNRVVGALTPLFDEARLNDGLYDYTIVCDERNNPPSTIDANEMRVSIYIQPVRTAEFILADFIATRTGVSFDELIS